METRKTTQEQQTTSSDFRKEDAYLRAKKKVDELKGFYWHLAVYVVVNLFIIYLVGFYSGSGFFSYEPYTTAAFWGIGLAFHFIGVFGSNLFLGKNWENRKLQEFMEEEQQRTW